MQKNHEVDVLLSCGHVEIIEIEAVIFAPEIGDTAFCSRCKEEASVQNVGVPWWKERENSHENEDENQIRMFKDEDLASK